MKIMVERAKRVAEKRSWVYKEAGKLQRTMDVCLATIPTSGEKPISAKFFRADRANNRETCWWVSYYAQIHFEKGIYCIICRYEEDTGAKEYFTLDGVNLDTIRAFAEEFPKILESWKKQVGERENAREKVGTMLVRIRKVLREV